MSTAAAAEHDHHHDEDLRGPPDEYGEATSGKIAMWLFLLSDAFSFSGLLLAYGILRGGVGDEWHLAGQPRLGINFTAGMTFLLICSSVTMVLAHAACVEGDRKGTLKFLGLTILGGVLFLSGQYYEYTHLSHAGLHLGDSHYSSTFYIITSFHGMHVFSGVVYLCVMWINTYRGKYDNGNHNHIEIAGLFWHFVDLVWILVFTFVYLL